MASRPCSMGIISAPSPFTTAASAPTNNPIVITTVPQATLVPAANTSVPPTVTNCTPRTDWPLYTVLAGDTLGTIAQRTQTSVNALTAANCLVNAHNIAAG